MRGQTVLLLTPQHCSRHKCQIYLTEFKIFMHILEFLRFDFMSYFYNPRSFHITEYFLYLNRFIDKISLSSLFTFISTMVK